LMLISSRTSEVQLPNQQKSLWQIFA